MAASDDLRIRPVREEDVETVFGLILELAEYEKLSAEVRGDTGLLRRALFEEGTVEALIVESDGEAVGYALFFVTFSSFECRPGIWLEDVYVRPEWCALDWNEPALSFYDKLGAKRLEEWTTLRLEGERLAALAQS